MKDSAGIMRRMLRECHSFHQLGTNHESLDRMAAWVLTASGMKLVIKKDVDAMGYKRGGNYYYSDQFLLHILAWSLDPHNKGSTKRVMSAIEKHYISAKADVPFMLPEKTIVKQLQMIAVSKYEHIISRGWSTLRTRDAFRVVTVDGTFKFLMSIIGQPKHGCRRDENSNRDGVHVVMTARTIDGCMFWAKTFGSEHAPSVVEKLALVQGVFEQLELLGVDRPKDWDVCTTFAALPRLQAISGDAMHLVFATSSAYGCSLKPKIVTCFKLLAEKWCATGSTLWLQGNFYRRGHTPNRPLTTREQMCWAEPSLSETQAQKVIDGIDCHQPFSSRLEYIKIPAAMKINFVSHLRRKTGDGKTTVGQVLQRAAQWESIEYLANGARWRVQNSILRDRMVNGTVGNEGDHFDVKSWGRNIIRQKRDRAEMMLAMWTKSKILTHESSFFSPNPRRNEDSGCYWLLKVLMKASNPSCELQASEPTHRRGVGALGQLALRRSPLSSASRQPAQGSTSAKRPAACQAVMKRILKRPSAGQQVWRRPSTTVTFRK